MKWPVITRNITVGALSGAVLGLLVGLLLVWLTDSIDNPFWAMTFGIIGGAGAGAVPSTRRDLDGR